MTAAHAGARSLCIFFLTFGAGDGRYGIGCDWGAVSDIDLRIIDRAVPANISSKIEHDRASFSWS
jgi:hypothetical protein